MEALGDSLMRTRTGLLGLALLAHEPMANVLERNGDIEWRDFPAGRRVS